MRSPSRCALVAGIAATLAACASYRPVAPTEVTPRTELRVQFRTPHVLTFRSAGGSQLVLDNVRAIEGQLIAIDADSATLGARKADRPDEMARFGPGTTTRVALTDVTMDSVSYHKGRTIFLVAVVVGTLALIVAAATYQEPPPPPPPEPKTK